MMFNLLQRLLAPKLNRRERMMKLLSELRESGMKIGTNVAIYNCVLDTNFPFLIEIGSNCIITHATLLAHDASGLVFGEGVVVGLIKIGDRCFIGAGACILPGVSIGCDSIVGANSVVTKDVPAGSVVVGNPGRVVHSISDWKMRLKSSGDSSEVSRKRLLAVGIDELVPTEAQSMEMAERARNTFLEYLV